MLAAILLSVARLLLPVIEDYKPDIEVWVSEMVGQQVEIATLDAAWYGLEPQLVLKGVLLLTKDRRETLGYLQQARIGLNVVGSIYEWRLKPGALTIEGAHLSIIRQVDGSITISGLENNAKKDKKKVSKSNNQALSDWLFNQRLLDIKNSEIDWFDLKSQSKNNIQSVWNFSQVNLRFRNDDDHHFIHGSVTLPDALGARLEVAMDARGDLLSAKGWSGSAYIEGANLRLKQWLENAKLFNASITDGMVGLRLWSQWKKAELISLKGEVFSNGFKIAVENEPKIQVIESLSTNISAKKIVSGWEATFDKIIVSTAKKVWPETRIDLKFDPSANSDAGRIDANISHINIEDVLPIVKLFAKNNSKSAKLLSHIKPMGEISHLNLSLLNPQSSPSFFVSAELSSFSNLPWKLIPGVKSVDAKIFIANDGFKIKLPKQNIDLNYSGVFSYPAKIQGLEGVLFGQNNETGFKLIAQNVVAQYRGAAAYGSLMFDSPIDDVPLLDLAFYFEHGDVSNAKYYIPSRIMNNNAVDWIVQSLQGGKVKNGGLIYFGKIKEYPFYQNEGLFDLSLNIEKGKLRFAKEWPKITDINGVFNLKANALSFKADTAKSMGSTLSKVIVDFPAFRVTDRKLLISGNVLGKSEDKIRYLHSSPLESIFAKNIAPLKVLGESELFLNLDIPLGDVTHTQVNGVVKVKDNQLLADEWKLNFDQLTTDLTFDNQGIYTDVIHASMDGIKLTGEIDTKVESKDVRNIIVSGKADVDETKIADLLDKFIDKKHWASYMKGETDINVSVKIPITSKVQEKEKNISLALNLNLENVALTLPYPLEKDKATVDSLKLNVDLSGDSRFLKIKTEKLNGLFEIMPVGKTQIITRGGIGFSQEAKLPTEYGFHFSGHLNRFSWTQWEPIIFPADNEVPLFSGGGANSSQYFNVTVDRLEIFGSWFGKTTIQASSGAQLWSIHLGGDDIAGEVFIPVVLSSGPLVMNMDKLVVVRSKFESADKVEDEIYLDPRKMPEIKITSKKFSFNNINFGSLNVVAKEADAGLKLETFSMKTKYTDITATGDWVEIEGKQKSTFDIKIKTKDLGKTIVGWGFEDAFGGGKGEVKIKAHWAGKPSDFSFEIAEGSMDVNIKDASLLDFDLGAAKMAGLFIPRRLLLDFRDVFKKGMHFDSIKGRYQISDGNAFTTNLSLDGPMADILMDGRIGLVAEDYDQLVTVNRRLVGDSISTLAALATNPLVNPLLAAQVYALKKLFEKQIDDILSVQYTITGSWEDPKITPVVKNLEQRGESIDELFE